MNRVDKEERMQRIRIGLTGLAFVFLLVLLGTAVSRSGNDPAVPPAKNELVSEEPNATSTASSGHFTPCKVSPDSAEKPMTDTSVPSS